MDEHAIGELYGFVEQHPEVGMTGSKVYHMEAPEYVQQFGIDVIWDEYCCEAKYCNWPEENFLYWDDTEWGIRCNRAGYKVASLGSSKVLHCMGEENRAKTVMYAYDDAIHGRMGKAEDDKIYPVVHSNEKLEKLLIGKKLIQIYANGWEEQAQLFKEKVEAVAKAAGLVLTAEVVEGHPAKRKEFSFTMTDDIFRLNDLELTTCYVDKEERILATEEDLFLVINREYSRKTFIFSQKNLFLTMVQKARRNEI